MNRMKKSLYVLEVITFMKKRRQHKDDYQPFVKEVSNVSFHKKFDEAESEIIRFLNEHSAWDDIYCFYIHQVPQNVLLTPYCLDSYAVWLYDQHGTLLDERPYPTYRFGCYFCGRPKEKLRFHIGDVVEYRSKLCIVISVPKGHYDNMLDELEDSYCVLYLDQDFDNHDWLNHGQAECIKVMSPRFPISQKVQDQITHVKEWYAEFQKKYKKQD